MAKIKKKVETMGKGCLVQLVGIVVGLFLCAFGAVGIVLGVCVILAALVYGSQLSQYFYCENCGTKLMNNKIAECPSCHQPLSK